MKVPVLPTPALTDIAVIMNDDVDDWYCQVGIIFKMQTLVKHCAHLQWTTTGSSPGFISSLKSRTNLKIKSILFREFFICHPINESRCSGTPLSGHPVKWRWGRTRRSPPSLSVLSNANCLRNWSSRKSCFDTLVSNSHAQFPPQVAPGLWYKTY